MDWAWWKKRRIPASAWYRNTALQYVASHCSLLKGLFGPLVISFMAFLMMCFDIFIAKGKENVPIYSLTFYFLVSSICAAPLLGSGDRSVVYLLFKLRLYCEMVLLCSCQVPNIYTQSADKTGSLELMCA